MSAGLPARFDGARRLTAVIAAAALALLLRALDAPAVFFDGDVLLAMWDGSWGDGGLF